MDRKFVVPVPKEKGISFQKTKTGTVVRYVVDWDRDAKGRSVPRYRVIGKLEPDGKGMVPNDNYGYLLSTFEEIREYRRHRDPRSYVAEMKLRRGQKLEIGPFLVLERAVKELRLEKLLREHFPDAATLLLDLASLMVLSEGRGGDFEQYAREHPLFAEDMRIPDEDDILETLKNVEGEDVSRFMEAWNDRLGARKEPGHVFSTQVRDDGPFPSWSTVTVGYDATLRVPTFITETHFLWSEVFDGSWVYTGEAGALGYNHCVLTGDPEAFTSEMAETVRKDGHDFVWMLVGWNPFSVKVKEAWGDALLRDIAEASVSGGLRGMTIHGRHKVFEEDESTLFVYLCCDVSGFREAEEDWASVEKELGASVGKALPKNRSAYDGFHLELDDEGRLLSWRRSEDFRREIFKRNSFVLVSSAEMSAEEAIRIIAVRHRSLAALEWGRWLAPHKVRTARRFVEFLGLILWEHLPTMFGSKSKLHWTDAFARLDVIALQRESTESPRFTLSVERRPFLRWLEPFGIPFEEAEASVARLEAALLASPSSTEPSLDADDWNDEDDEWDEEDEEDEDWDEEDDE